MPKSSKKRKEKAADFSKAKLKLGKGKKAPSNEIDTSFKARSVALPNQTIRTEEHVAEQGVPTTRRRLTYNDLLVHLKHYSPGTRKDEDALQGFRELLGDHPELINRNLGSLLEAVSKLIADEDHSVRKSLITFLEWVLDQIPVNTLAPHAPPLLLFAAAALAHISAPVRADAVRVIGVLLERVPEAVVAGAGLREVGEEGPGARILDGLLAALGIGDARGVGGDQSLTASTKSTLLSTLSKFLRHALQVSPTTSTTDAIPVWYFASSFSSSAAFNTFTGILQHREPEPRIETRVLGLDRGERVGGLLGCDFDTLEDAELESNNHARSGGDTAPMNVFAARLHPLLISTFLDTAPQLRLSSSPSLELVSSAVELARMIYGATIRGGRAANETFDNLNTLLGHMAPYFPFGDRGELGISEQMNMKTLDEIQALNLAYCELVSLYMSHVSTPRKRMKKRSAEAVGGKQVDEVASYVVRSLRGETGAAPGLPSALSTTAYLSLLPILWAIRDEQEVISATVSHATGSGGSKAVKRAAVEFVGRMILLNSDPRGHKILSLNDTDVRGWILSLPRTVWEFGEKDARGTEIVLLLLLRLHQRRIFDGPTTEMLRQRLAPFFVVDHPKKGAILGPWIKLPHDLQKLGLEVMSSLCGGGGECIGVLTSAIDRVIPQSALGEYWSHIRAWLY